MDALSESEINTYLEALHRMDYEFSVIARNETFYGGEFLSQRVGESPVRFTSANVYYNGVAVAPPAGPG